MMADLPTRPQLTNTGIRLLSCIAGTALLAMFFVFSAGEAQASVGLTIQPIKVSHTLNPGESTSGSIRISNASAEPVNVDLKVEDFIPLAGTETVQFVGRAPGLTTLRDWIQLEGPSTFELAEGGTKIINYTIAAPYNAEPGGHFGVAFFKASRIGDEAQLKVSTQVGMLMLVTIPGNNLQKGRILSFDAPTFIQGNSVIFTTKFENTGTVHFEPKGTITITNILGSVLAEVPVEGQVVLPTGIKDLKTELLVDHQLFGMYKARITLKDGEGVELTADQLTFYAFPLWYTLSFLGVLIAVFLLLRFFRRRFSISIARKD